MYDAVVAMTDIVSNLASLGQDRYPYPPPYIIDTFQASDGWFVMQVVREHQFERLAQLVGRPEWTADPRFSTRAGWGEHLDGVLRPGIEAWAAHLTKRQAAEQLTAAGVAAGPCHDAHEMLADPQLARRHMLVEMERTDGAGPPVLIPGNPVKLSKLAEEAETRVPWVGEHTHDVLRTTLGLSVEELDGFEAAGVIGPRSPVPDVTP
jgi:crotonobetainyl-CoA:carnitine CoA-transferase CaiB-like acyl-CoA transferase